MLIAATNRKETAFKIKEIHWSDIRNEVANVNPELANICDQINPGKQHTLFKIRYPYGAKIVSNGNFHIPTRDNKLVSIKDPSIPLSLRKKLSYCPIPLSLVLHNKTEVFVEINRRVTPLNFFKPGDLFGVFESMNPLTASHSNPIWSVTSGGRSVFMIPRITDKIGHNRIRKAFGFAEQAPTDLISQWKIFKAISENSNSREKWYNEVLVFTDTWFEEHNEDVPWLKFHKYLFKLYWLQTQLLRDVTECCLLWSSFADEISNRNLKPRPYLVDTLKHLVSIANGSGIAFKPAIDDTALPVALIQTAYVDFYNLKNYIPTIMQPCKLQITDNKVYYSLALPTVLESSPYVKNAPSVLQDQRDIKRLLNTLIRTIKYRNTIINPIQHINYDFFHCDTDQYGEISNSKDIILDDDRFNYTSSNALQERTFCATSPFFRGCIRISMLS